MDEKNDLTENLILNSPDEPAPVVPPPGDDAESEEGSDEANDLFPEQTWTKGEKQPVRFRDWPFAVIFYLQIASIVVIAFVFGVPAMSGIKENDIKEDQKKHGIDYSGFLYLALLAGCSSFVLSAISLTAMTIFAESLVKVSLFFSISFSLFMAIFALWQNDIFLSLASLLFFAIGLCYAYAVWDRIPFAAANLKTALTAIKANCGITLVGYFLTLISFAWIMLWVLALVGVWSQTADCKDETCEESGIGNFFLFLMILSLFWTQQVIQNTIHVTVAGTIGEWWFEPSNASSCCSEAVLGSFFRATTYSFGSICFGSLLVAIAQTLQQIAQNVRNRGGDNILLCLVQCILNCFESMLEYFNHWAYVYVGLYGYSYIEAGKNVITLFQQRGWTAIINDSLVSRTLTLVCLVLAGLSGCIGLVLNSVGSSWFEYLGEGFVYGAFFIAFTIGLVIASILTSVIDSAVNTVVVLFAEDPAEFQSNHPGLSRGMRDAWGRIYPESGFVNNASPDSDRV